MNSILGLLGWINVIGFVWMLYALYKANRIIKLSVQVRNNTIMYAANELKKWANYESHLRQKFGGESIDEFKMKEESDV